MAQHTIQIEYEITRADFDEAGRALRSGASATWRWVYRSGYAASAAGFVLLVNRPRVDNWPGNWVAPALLIAFGLFVLVSTVVAGYANADRAWAESAHVLQPHECLISDDGVRLTTPLILQEYRWTAFRRLQETRNLFLLYLTASSPLILPKRSFPDAEAMASLRQMAEERLPRADRGFPIEPR